MKSVETKPMNGWRAFISIFGIALGLIVFGAFLCIFIIGAIVGIPLIIGGVILLIISPFAKYYVVEGKCPHCEKVLQAITLFQKSTKCPDCKKRIIVRDKKFLSVD